ncbi:glycosyltransferase family 39 protein, partial [Candidatus Woesearchaeota archaeon]|nr:glycosyltransferase family 39 protein [Candidatus Woesearchaeota archaeon]
PLTIRLLNPVFGGNSLLAGMVLSHIFAFIGLAFFYAFTRDMFSSRVATVACVLFIAFPTSFFTSLVYTEALFFMLTVMFMYFLYRDMFWPALAASFLIPLVRPPGFLLIAPLFFFILYRQYREKSFRFMRLHLLFLGFTAGLGSYLIMMKYYTGSFFTGFMVQKYMIADNSVLNLFFLPQWFMRNFWNLDWTLHTFVWSAIDRIFFVLFLVVLYLIFRELDTTMFTYALAVGLVPAFAGNFLAYTRYLLVVFPIYMVLAKRLKGNYIYIFVPMLMLQTLFIVMHALNYWVA